MMEKKKREKELRQKGREKERKRRVQVTEPVRSLERKRNQMNKS